MVIHNCEICNFSSRYTTNYKSHCMSIKHLRNLETIENEKSKVIVNTLTQDNATLTQNNASFYKLTCEFCDKKYARIDIKTRHLKTCKKKKKKKKKK